MTLRNRLCAATIAALALLAACQDKGEPAAPGGDPAPDAGTAAPAPDPDSVVPEEWLGRWNGPEGTFLDISKGGDGYSIAIQSLDGRATYQGKASGDHIVFERRGKMESIRATDGVTTGMKWLADKSDCLTVNPGEGFCRD